MKEFTNEEKIKAFDQIAELFYDRNFSVASKSEIELLMFSIYLDAAIKAHTNEQNILNYEEVSDYKLAKQLGITQEKVRSLKIRKQARYPVEYDWQASLKSIQDNIRLENNRIVIPIPDPNLNIEIRNFINEKGGFVDVESGKDYIKIRVEYYLMLMYYTLGIENQKKFIKEMKKALGDKNADENAFQRIDKHALANDMLSLAVNSTEIINQVVSVFSPSNTLASILSNLLLPH